MKKNIFFLILAVFCMAFSLDAAQKLGEEVNRDYEKGVEIAGITNQDNLDEKGWGVLRKKIEKKLLGFIEAGGSKDEKETINEIEEIINSVAKFDPGNKRKLITQDCINQCIIKAFVNKKKEIFDTLPNNFFLVKNNLLSIAQIAQIKSPKGKKPSCKIVEGETGNVIDCYFVEDDKILSVRNKSEVLCIVFNVKPDDYLLVVRYDNNDAHVYHCANQSGELIKLASCKEIAPLTTNEGHSKCFSIV